MIGSTRTIQPDRAPKKSGFRGSGENLSEGIRSSKLDRVGSIVAIACATGILSIGLWISNLYAQEASPNQKARITVTSDSTTGKPILILHDKSGVDTVFQVAIGRNGWNKQKEGDMKTPVGEYRVQWMASDDLTMPLKHNPSRESSRLTQPSYCALHYGLTHIALDSMRIVEIPTGKGIKKVLDPDGRLITSDERKMIAEESLFSAGYGGEGHRYLMGLDYPSDRDFSDGRTGTAIIIHSNERIDAVGLGAYKGTAGCVGMYTRDSRLVYLAVEPGSPVIISP